jgi:Na+/proline symporter/signal transduction histidine kinase
MIDGWLIVLVALGYLCLLFMVAHFGDTASRGWQSGRLRPVLYALTIAVYCTSWTFMGSVGLASRAGYDFLPIYLGPALVFLFGWRVLQRIVKLGKTHNTTSIADMIAARYGKSETVAAVVAIICLIGIVPYIALQLKAVSLTLGALSLPGFTGSAAASTPFPDAALWVAFILAFFATAFGTRNIDATKPQHGLMLAVATESVVKLVAFLCIGFFVVFGLFGSFEELWARAAASPTASSKLIFAPDVPSWVVTTTIAGFAAILLPRQFHVLVVENRSLGDVRRAAWMFPLYLVAINIFVIPIAIAGLLLFPGMGDYDLTVLALPAAAKAPWVLAIAVIGALSAATAMVIVETVALSVMIANDLIFPMVLRRRRRVHDMRLLAESGVTQSYPLSGAPMGGIVLTIRRVAILVIVLMGYAYYRLSNDAALASIGLLSFAAVSQLAPAFFGGLLWHRATARGAVGGMVIGIAAWAVLLFIPSLATAGTFMSESLVHSFPYVAEIREQGSLIPGLTPFSSGVVISLLLNVFAYIALSYTRSATPIERLQANVFIGVDADLPGQGFRLWRSAVTVGELKHTVARYLGEERTNHDFEEFAKRHGGELSPQSEADAHTIRYTEHLLASVIGAASSRLVLSLMLRRRNVSTEAALKLLDDASAAMQYSRTLLQNALDHAKQGVSVFDSDLRLVCWNHAFRDLFDLPGELVRFGVGLDQIIGYNAQRGLYGPEYSSDSIATRLESFVHQTEPVRLRLRPLDKVLEIRSNHLPDGGIVTTYTDITEQVGAEEALEQANESLERRVEQRTIELKRVNDELGRAKAEADQANLSKTRFLAAASHDILQPLNAARLYATSLVERAHGTEQAELASNVGASLDAVEEILGALLEISRLDTGKLKPDLSVFRIDEMFRQLSVEFAPLAREKGLTLRFVSSRLSVYSDRRLLRRALQNLISNAIKYTPEGKVLVGCRRRGDHLAIEVADTGIGIPAEKQKLIFKEFQRLDEGAREAKGLGLGLSIVDRIARVLDHALRLRTPRRGGSVFSVELPIAPEILHGVAEEAEVATPALPLAGLHILAIDNEPAILDGLTILLSGWGCSVATAADYAAARIAFRKRRPHIILADYHLDGTTGIDVVRRLRSRHRANVPAILITADRSTEVREQAANNGMQLMQKPLKPAALRAVLTQARTALDLAAE